MRTDRPAGGPTAPLAALGEVLWPGAALDPVGRGTRGASAAEQYVVLPSLRRPRYLVPAALSSRAIARMLREYNGLRAPGTRVLRTGLAALAHAGGLPGRRTQRLDVHVDEAGGSLRHLVARELGLDPRELALACSVRGDAAQPRPIVTVVDLSGMPVLFVKVARSAIHRRRLATEHEMLVALGSRPVAGVRTPEPVFLRAWQHALVLATAPLPSSVSALHAGDGDRASRRLVPHEAARRHASSPTVAESPWVEAIRERAERLPDADRLRSAVDAVTARHGDVSLPHGLGHGDWTCWNAAELPDRDGDLVVWDWEFGQASAPLGIDRLHWDFASATTMRGIPLERVLAQEAAQGPAQKSALSSLHLLEMATRRVEDASLGHERARPEAGMLLDHLGG